MTTIPTHTLLNLTEQQFEIDCFERYMRWCELMTASYNRAHGKNIKVGCLLANTALSKYYKLQELELFHSFNIAASKVYKMVSQKIIHNMFSEIMAELAVNYPSALIEAAASLKIENQISLN